MENQQQRAKSSFRLSRMGQTLVVGGWILLGAVPTAGGFIMWHNAQMQTVGSAWVEQVVTTSDDYETQLADSRTQIADLDEQTADLNARIVDLDAKVLALDARIAMCQDSFDQSQKVVAAYIAAKYQDSVALGNFFNTYSFAAGDVGALYDSMGRSNQPILDAHVGLTAECL